MSCFGRTDCVNYVKREERYDRMKEKTRFDEREDKHMHLGQPDLTEINDQHLLTAHRW